MPHATTTPATNDSGRAPVLARLLPTLKSLAIIVLLPLALLALGLWEVERGQASLAGLERSQTELLQALQRLRDLASRTPHAVVRFEGAKSAVTAELAARQVERWIGDLEGDLTVARARRGLAWTVVAGSALLLAAGLLGLALLAAARTLARLSRDKLVGAFSVLRRVLPVLLAAQTAGLALAAIAAGLFEIGGLWFAERVSAGEGKLVIAALLLGAVALYAAFQAIRGLRRAFALFTPEPLDVLGRRVDEAEAPGLWRFTGEIARRQEALAPDHVVVGLTEGFFVTSAAVRLWPEERLLTGRTLHLPAPWLALLNGREVAAIVGHELAHFSGEDTAYSGRFAPIYAGFERALGALAVDRGGALVLWPAIALGQFALRTFDTAVARWSRLREFEADRLGSTVSGRQAAASALVRTAVITPLIHKVLERAANAPARAGEDLVAAVDDAVRGGLKHPEGHLDDRQPHPTDSHPPTRQRLAALGVEPDAALLAQATRPVGDEERALRPALFADWPGLCRTLSRDLLARLRDQDAELREVLEQAAAAGPAEEVALYENSRPAVWLAGILAAFFAAFAAMVSVFAEPLGFRTDPVVRVVLGAVCGAVALGIGAYGRACHRRGQEPFLMLTPDGLRSPLLRAPVAWTDVAGIGVAVDRGLVLTLALAPDAPLPERVRRVLRVQVNRRRHEVVIGSNGVRGLKPQEYADLVAGYLNGARARAVLATREAA